MTLLNIESFLNTVYNDRYWINSISITNIFVGKYIHSTQNQLKKIKKWYSQQNKGDQKKQDDK